jgi:hypothetical protein
MDRNSARTRTPALHKWVVKVPPPDLPGGLALSAARHARPACHPHRGGLAREPLEPSSPTSRECESCDDLIGHHWDYSAHRQSNNAAKCSARFYSGNLRNVQSRGVSLSTACDKPHTSRASRRPCHRFKVTRSEGSAPASHDRRAGAFSGRSTPCVSDTRGRFHRRRRAHQERHGRCSREGEPDWVQSGARRSCQVNTERAGLTEIDFRLFTALELKSARLHLSARYGPPLGRRFAWQECDMNRFLPLTIRPSFDSRAARTSSRWSNER